MEGTYYTITYFMNNQSRNGTYFNGLLKQGKWYLIWGKWKKHPCNICSK